jgi:sodium pump decarboxylase gamma subunit
MPRPHATRRQPSIFLFKGQVLFEIRQVVVFKGQVLFEIRPTVCGLQSGAFALKLRHGSISPASSTMLEQSLTILVIGMTTVVVFLLLLVLTIHAMGLVAGRFLLREDKSEPDDLSPPLPSAEALAVAVAAAKRESIATTRQSKPR